MKPYTYLLVNFLTVIICFIASFDSRIKFYRYFIAFIKAVALVAIPFIIWDIWFTAEGVWWFNSEYTLGLSIFGLPIEEWLFFICIPFACVFTYFCFTKFFNLDWAEAFNNIIVFISVIICGVIALLYPHQIYTLVTALITIFTLLYMHFIARVTWIGKASLVYLILMLGFFPVNGVLTGTGLKTPIVNYNSADFLNFRLLSIPIEDAVYGYTQFLLIIYFFNKFKKTSSYED